MKNKKHIFTSLAALMLVASLASETVAQAAATDAGVNQTDQTTTDPSQTNDTTTPNTDNTNQPTTNVPSDNNTETNEPSKPNKPSKPSKIKTKFKGLSTKYKWTAGDKISDEVSLNSKEIRKVYLQRWNGKKYVNQKSYHTSAAGTFKVTYPATWYHHLHTTWRLFAPATDSATSAKSAKIGISTVRRYKIPKGYRQLHMKSLHLKGYYTSPLDKSLNYASSRNDYVKAFIKRGYQYKNAGTAWIDFTSKKPGTSVDCSGLVMQCMYAAGIDPSPANPRWHATHEWGCRSFVQSNTLQTVSLNHLKPGDLIFYGQPQPVCYHVGIYLGNNKVLHSWPNWGVTVSNANFRTYYYAKRVFPVVKTQTVHSRN